MNLFNVDKVSMKPRVSGMFSSCQNCQSISSFSVRNKKIPRNSLQLQSVSKLLTLPVHVASWQAPRIIMAFLFFFGRKCFSSFERDPNLVFTDWLIATFCRPGLQINTALCSAPLCQREELKQQRGSTATTGGQDVHTGAETSQEG